MSKKKVRDVNAEDIVEDKIIDPDFTVVEEPEDDEPEIVGLAPVKYEVNDAKIAAIAETVKDLSADTKEGYKAVCNAISIVVSTRTGIEKHRNALLTGARSYTADVNGEAKRLTALVAEIEEPLKAKRSVVDEAKEAERQRKIGLRKRIEDMKDMPVTIILDPKRQTVTGLNELSNDLENLDLSDMGDLKGEMDAAVDATQEKITELMLVAKAREDEAKALEAQRKELAEIEERQKKDREKRDEDDRIKREEEEAKRKAKADADQAALDEEKAALQKEKDDIAAERKKIDDDKAEVERQARERELQEQADKDKAEAVAKAEKDAEEKAKREIAEEAERVERKAAEDKAEEDRLAALAPDKKKLAAYAEVVRGVALACPELSGKKAREILTAAVKLIGDANDKLLSLK